MDPRTPSRYTGRVSYVYAYDIAYDMLPVPGAGAGAATVTRLLGQPVTQFQIDLDRRLPKQLFFYRPVMVRLPVVQRQGPRGAVTIERTVKLYPVGAVSITVSVPFDVGGLEELVAYHELSLEGTPLHDEALRVAQEVWRELTPMLIRPVVELSEEEAYTVFCIKSWVEGDGVPSAEAWLRSNRRAIAALLTQEDEPAGLADQEVRESTSQSLAYYDRDLIVVDWDAALVVDDESNFDETLHIMELANVQLAELESYDRVLDAAVQRSYADLTRRPWFRRGDILRDLREIRVDLTRLSDELLNITKFFGDWHLARLYTFLSKRFHLAEWHATIDEKLKTLDELYQLIAHDQNNRWMLVLEAAIVLLFVIDIVAIFGPWAH